MPHRAFRIAYDGRPYHGFQRQPDVTTVEDELFGALDRLDVLDGDKPAGYAAAGRTDAGVSALRQTVAFDAPVWLTPSAINSELSRSIRAWAYADAPADFHATHDAREREYRYFWLAPERSEGAERASGERVPERNEDTDCANGGAVSADRPASPAPTADVERAKRALDELTGEHDFHNLTPDEEGTVRDLSGFIERQGDFLVVTVRAGGFCRELVRRVVSVVQEIEDGVEFGRIDRVLGDEAIEGPEGVPPADPHPLVLHDVGYDLEFEVDESAAADARERFATRRDDRRSLARVAGHVADEL